MIDIKEKTQCCGCNACGDVCPKGAITFAADDEGFLYPQVNRDKCINCDLCRKVCPQLRAEEMKRGLGHEAPECWAAVAKSLSVRFDSTSGGMFTTLADYVLSQGGYVGGAVYGEDFSIHQIVSDRATDLPRLRSSKYAQSDAQGFYKSVKAAVLTGRLVFVCGTPCQMAAVKLYVGDAENLYTADFICRGINSPLALRKYIEHHEAMSGKKIVAMKHKSKELGWRSLSIKLTFEDGEVKYDKGSESLFMRPYFPPYTVLSRPTCYECKYKGVHRATDLTISDCWGVVKKLDPWKFDQDLGTSSVICHTQKGRMLFDAVSNKLEREEINIDDIVAGSKTICDPLEREGVDRGQFYSTLNKAGLEMALKISKPIAKCRADLRRQILGIVRRCYHGARRLMAITLHPSQFIMLVKINGLSAVFHGRPCLRPIGNVLWQKETGARIVVLRGSEIGVSLFKGSSLESRVLLTAGSRLILEGCQLGYGCNIQIFNGGTVAIGSGFYCNIGATIICSGSIKIGRNVICGRNVTIREYHGDHFLNSDNYKCSKPVEIGDHVWLCEYSTVMPGVKIGAGSVVASHSLVTKDVPPNTLVAGCPARVIRTNVQWKA